MIFVSATDVGGARAILPVLRELDEATVPFCIMDTGVLSSESPASYRRIAVDAVNSEQAFQAFLDHEQVDLVCIGTAVKDRLPIYQGEWAKRRGLSVVAVLDNWMNYRQRFELPDAGLRYPTHYFVMDQLAYDEAVHDEVPSDILEITGHPGLAGLASEAVLHRKASAEGGQPLRLLFLSEPAALDQGTSPASPTYRGYTEFDVLRMLADYFADLDDTYELIIAPHPREDREALSRFCADLFPENLAWAFSDHAMGRDAVFDADGVVGMTSILLYEAWLLGIPVLSLQPGLIGKGASHVIGRDACYAVTEASAAPRMIQAWMCDVQKNRGAVHLREELSLHAAAARRVAQRLIEIQR